jgi:hypothetical protein
MAGSTLRARTRSDLRIADFPADVDAAKCLLRELSGIRTSGTIYVEGLALVAVSGLFAPRACVVRRSRTAGSRGDLARAWPRLLRRGLGPRLRCPPHGQHSVSRERAPSDRGRAARRPERGLAYLTLTTGFAVVIIHLHESLPTTLNLDGDPLGLDLGQVAAGNADGEGSVER